MSTASKIIVYVIYLIFIFIFYTKMCLQIIIHSMGLTGSKANMDETEQKVREEIDDQIAKYKIFMVSKKSCPFCRTSKVQV